MALQFWTTCCYICREIYTYICITYIYVTFVEREESPNAIDIQPDADDVMEKNLPVDSSLPQPNGELEKIEHEAEYVL